MLRNKLRTAEILRQIMLGIRDQFDSAVHNELYRILPSHKVWLWHVVGISVIKMAWYCC
jgi:hypothetical protein